MTISIIRDESSYEQSLGRIEDLWNSERGTPEGEELELLMLVVEKYEEEQHPVLPPDPIEAIRFRMEQLGLKNDAALAERLQLARSRVSELLNRRRRLTLEHIRKLSRIGIPASVLIVDYELNKAGGLRDQKAK